MVRSGPARSKTYNSSVRISFASIIRFPNEYLSCNKDDKTMELSQLEVFLAVAREHRFSRAAEKLYRTQSAVSQTIRKLEDELGEALFDRSSREGVLTDAGKVMLEYAEKMIN